MPNFNQASFSPPLPAALEIDSLQAMLDCTTTHLAYLDSQFNFVRVNEAYVRGCGYSRAELIGCNHFELFPNAENQAIFEQVRDTGQTVVFRARAFEFPHQPWRGMTYWDWTLTPVKDAAGRVQGLVLSLEEVTGQVKAQQRLEETYALLNAMFASSPVGLAFLDRDLRYARVNQTLADMNGLPVEAHLGKTPAELLPGLADLDGLMAALRRVLTTSEPMLGVEITGTTWAAPGQTAYALCNWFPLQVRGRVMGLGVTVQDITSRVEVERQLKTSLQEKEVLLREVNHRVRNNLQAIYNLLYLQASYTRNEEVRAILSQTQDRVRAIALVHDKLLNSKDLVQVDFAEYVYSLATHLIRSHYPQPGAISLKVKFPGLTLDVETAVPLGVIVTELITNSLKYAFPAGAEPGSRVNEISIDLKTEPDGQTLLVVGDNGVGLPEEMDVNQAQRLGLRLVDLLASYMQGTVEVERHNGTTVRVRLRPVGGGGEDRG